MNYNKRTRATCAQVSGNCVWRSVKFAQEESHAEHTAGIDMQHIPYKGGGAVLPDLIAGRVSMFFGSIATLRPHVESGRLRAVGMTTSKRSAAMPDVPTFIESRLTFALCPALLETREHWQRSRRAGDEGSI